MKYTKEELEKHAPNCHSFCALARSLGRHQHGGVTANLKRCCIKLGIDFSHFTGRKNRKCPPSNKKLHWRDRLVLRPKDSRREKHYVLKRALVESGREYKCESCDTGSEYNGKPLIIEINHKNGIVWDDRKENLEFACPNCHSQTPNYKNKSR